jgi:hypothetical protein
MGDSSNQPSNLPLAGLASIAVASLALLVAHDAPFLATRPPEPLRQIEDFSAVQRVEARLWQDPFAAVEEFERQELMRRKFDEDAAALGKHAGAGSMGMAEATAKVGPIGVFMPPAGTASVPDQSAASFGVGRFGAPLAGFPDYLRVIAAGDARHGGTLGVLAVMVSGSHFVGAEESRRRSRYAVVSALGELDYAPIDNEHIGYVMVPLGSTAHSDPMPIHSSVRVPFETFRLAHDRHATAQRAAVLPENVLVLWIDDVAINAPGTHTQWVLNLQELLLTLGLDACSNKSGAGTFDMPFRCFTRIIGPASSDEYASLASAELRNGAAALPPLISPLVTSDIRFSPAVLAGIERERLTIIPTIASDASVLKRIVHELWIRNLPLCVRQGEAERSILLFGEWDTEYGRRAQQTLTDVLNRYPIEGCPQQAGRPRVVFHSFVRGLDGVAVGNKNTPDVKSTPTSLTTDSAANTGAATQIEWPEGSDERDYLRRLGQHLQMLPDVDRAIAVGVFATDTHDKLLLLQALRARFPGLPFFTTDLDARLAHPLVRRWTRNLIVGSSFGLSLSRDIQVRTPPFRDSYQTATFLATLAAIQPRVTEAGSDDGALQGWIRQPVLFEIGRTRIVPLLEEFDQDSSTTVDPSQPPCGPRTLTNCATIQPRHPPRHLGYRLPLGVALLFLTLAVSMLLWPLRSQGFATLLGQGVNATAQDRGASRGYPHTTATVMSRIFLLGLILAIMLLGYLLARAMVPGWTLLPIEPRLLMEGVSSWPVAFCWSFALALTFMYLLRIFLTVQARFNATEDRYLAGGTAASESPDPPPGYWHWLWRTLVQPEPCPDFGSQKRRPFATIWAAYRYNAQGMARLQRIALYWVLLFLIPFLLVHRNDLTPVYAVRGALRGYVHFLNWADFIMLTVLMAVVADAVLLCTIFVVDLGRQRNSYPDVVLAATCTRLGLGSGLEEHLDEYIDTCVIGDRTAAVAEYLYYPFVVLAVLAISMTSIFDNWTFDWTRVALYSFYGLVLGLLWLALHQAAIRTRQRALEEMDIISLKLQTLADTASCPARALRSQFGKIVQRVSASKEGAYGPLLRQPIFSALLWPLSGVSTAQLVSYFF